MNQDTRLGGDAAAFPLTRWTAVLAAKEGATARENLDYLIRVYWKPVYRYIRVGWSKSNEDAKDLAQDFFASLLARESLKSVGPEKGRFRSFLKAALKNFLMQEKRDAGRQKRSAKAVVDIEVDLPDLKADTPDEAFDREWAATVLDSALEKLEKALNDEGKSVYFTMFREFYFGSAGQLSYDQLADKHGLKRFDVGNHLKTARAKFREIAIAMIGETVTGDAEAEFRELFGGGL
ncbi:MAG TPA: sigma-70 family RNA polymerase sigma factor [Planctomycetota bacterium]|nr:sigma-70 family RNA polymerase sigma factor [Planctomycetota bacterium]